MELTNNFKIYPLRVCTGINYAGGGGDTVNAFKSKVLNQGVKNENL